jgi:hypothetical protein
MRPAAASPLRHAGGTRKNRQPVAPLHLPKKLDELDRLPGVREHALASRETVVHVVQTVLDKHPQVARHPLLRCAPAGSGLRAWLQAGWQ